MNVHFHLIRQNHYNITTFYPSGIFLKKYAPCTHKYGFHFKTYDNNIFTPVIRKQIREIVPVTKEHYTVYLPAYSDENIIKVLREAKEINWQIFSKHSKKTYSKKNFIIRPISNESFIESFSTCTGMLCGAGFETPAEALFLKKKLMVIPMKNQYEQYCNAAALEDMGVAVLKSSFFKVSRESKRKDCFSAVSFLKSKDNSAI